MSTCKYRRELDDGESIEVSGGEGPQPTRGHSACDVKDNPTSSHCAVMEALRKQYAALGECEYCRFNPNAQNW